MKEIVSEHKKLISILIGAMTMAAMVLVGIFFLEEVPTTIPVPTALEEQVVTEVPTLQKVESFASQEAFDKAHPELKGIFLLATSTTKTQ